MLKLIFLFINILSLTLQIDHCIRTYEICTKCDTGYYIVQNEYQYICSHIPNCLTIDDDGTTCNECTNGTIPHENEQCQIIDNCRKYEDGLYCSECIDDYALSYDRKKCVKYDNCRELDKNNRCQLCAKHYKLSSKGNCLRSVCEKEEKGQCVSCTEGFHLLDGECVKIPIDYCSVGDSESCTECFHYAPDLIEGHCVLDKLISGCNKVDLSDATKCTHCSMGYQLSDDKTKCELTNCANIEEVCYQCEDGYFIADNGKECLSETIVESEKDFSAYLELSCLYLILMVIFL